MKSLEEVQNTTEIKSIDLPNQKIIVGHVIIEFENHSRSFVTIEELKSIIYAHESLSNSFIPLQKGIKLTAEIAKEIRSSTFSRKKLREKYGVSKSMIQLILNNKRWKI